MSSPSCSAFFFEALTNMAQPVCQLGSKELTQINQNATISSTTVYMQLPLPGTDFYCQL